jgi:hypothetical protein
MSSNWPEAVDYKLFPGTGDILPVTESITHDGTVRSPVHNHTTNHNRTWLSTPAL